MEQVDADDGVRKDSLCDADEASVHVTAEKTDAPAAVGGIVPEIFYDFGGPDLRKDIQDSMGRAVNDGSMVLGRGPAFSGRIPDAGLSLELIHAEDLRELLRLPEFDKIHDSGYDIRSHAVLCCNGRDGQHFRQIQADAKIE